MITIKNLHKEKPSKSYDIRVDRKSILGNPYFMSNNISRITSSERDRDKVCDKYHQYFTNIISDPQYEKFRQELERLKEIHERYGKLNLFCWCAPKRCHAETIKQYLEL